MSVGAPTCPICGHDSPLLDVVDFNKNCLEPNGVVLPLCATPIYYALCDNCGFCFAPEFAGWTAARFSQWIYNSDYLQVDPEFVEARPRRNANSLLQALGPQAGQIRHLD